jgi:hypothetical protein
LYNTKSLLRYFKIKASCIFYSLKCPGIHRILINKKTKDAAIYAAPF